MAVPNTRFTEPVLKFIEEFNDLKLITKLHFVWENVNIIIDWRPVCFHAIWTYLVTLVNLPRAPLGSYRMNVHTCDLQVRG